MQRILHPDLGVEGMELDVAGNDMGVESSLSDASAHSAGSGSNEAVVQPERASRKRVLQSEFDEDTSGDATEASPSRTKLPKSGPLDMYLRSPPQT